MKDGIRMILAILVFCNRAYPGSIFWPLGNVYKADHGGVRGV